MSSLQVSSNLIYLIIIPVVLYISLISEDVSAGGKGKGKY